MPVAKRTPRPRPLTDRQIAIHTFMLENEFQRRLKAVSHFIGCLCGGKPDVAKIVLFWT